MTLKHRASLWVWLVVTLLVVFGGLLIRSIAIYERGRHQLDALEAALPVGITRHEAYDRIRALGFIAYGTEQAVSDANMGVVYNHWARYWNATVPWPDENTNYYLQYAVIAVPIGGVICDKRAVIMLGWGAREPNAQVGSVREVGPELRCWLPVVVR